MERRIGPARRVAVVNQKGGVGKTTTTINLAGALAEAGHRVLAVDLDPQGHLTVALKLTDAPVRATLAAALTGRWDGDPAELIVIYPGAAGRLAVIPNTVDMFTAGRELDRLRAREERLGRILDGLTANGPGLFDFILIDCPPALDVLTDNALNAMDCDGSVLIPVQAEDSSLRALRLLLAQITALEAELRVKVPIAGLVVSMLDRGAGGRARSNLARSVVDELDRLGVPVLATVPRGVTLPEAWRFGQPVTEYAPGLEHARIYHALADKLSGSP